MAGKLERGLRVSDVRPVQRIVRECLGSYGTCSSCSHDERLPVGHQRSGDGVTGGHGVGKRIDGKSYILLFSPQHRKTRLMFWNDLNEKIYMDPKPENNNFSWKKLFFSYLLGYDKFQWIQILFVLVIQASGIKFQNLTNLELQIICNFCNFYKFCQCVEQLNPRKKAVT